MMALAQTALAMIKVVSVAVYIATSGVTGSASITFRDGHVTAKASGPDSAAGILVGMCDNCEVEGSAEAHDINLSADDGGSTGMIGACRGKGCRLKNPKLKTTHLNIVADRGGKAGGFIGSCEGAEVCKITNPQVGDHGNIGDDNNGGRNTVHANEVSSEAITNNQASEGTGTRSSSPTPSYVEPNKQTIQQQPGDEIESASVSQSSIPYFAAFMAIIILILTTACFLFPKEEIPKFGKTDQAAYMKKIKLSPSTVEENEPFLNQVKVIVHVVNSNEKWAVLANMEPPDNQHEENNTTKIIKVETGEGDIKLWLALGKFGGYRIAVLQTEMGNYCGPELRKAKEILPNVKCVIGVGVAFAFKKEYRLGDVLVSKLIVGGSDLKGENGIIQLRNAVSRNISQALTLIFIRDADIWAANINFECNKDGRKSKVHPGGIVSAPLLTNDKKMRDAIYKRFPEAVGGEMEGHMYMKLNDDHECEFEYIIIKGVADYGDGKKNKVWQFTAAMAAVNFVKFMLERTEGKMYSED